MKTRHLSYYSNQMTGLYIMGTLVINGFIIKRNICLVTKTIFESIRGRLKYSHFT